MLLRNFFIGACLVSLFDMPSLAQQTMPPVADVEPLDAPASPIAPIAPVLAARALAGQHFPSHDLFYDIAGHHQNPADLDLQKAMENYQQSESDSDARTQAKDKIQKALGEQYDVFLTEQEKQLDAMEKKLADLRDQLKQRRGAKEKMVDLKFEMVLAQLDGLGWPDSDDIWTARPMIRRYFNQSGSHNLLTTEPAAAAESPRATRSNDGEKSRSITPRSRGNR